MCGIIAFVDPKGTNKEGSITSMMDMIQHRGPNSGGSFINETAALGFRRLSIIDLAGGTQPIYNEDDTKVITFNGEIYNYKEIRSDLIEAGHEFKTQSDTEVLLHGYEEYGMAKLLDKVRGMFAFLIWDSEANQLVGARDFFGIKPLYYYNRDGQFIVGSEIKSFLEHPDFVKELNIEAVKPYLMNQYNDLEETFFKGVYRFPAGHWFTYKDGELNMHQYWDADYTPNDLSFEDTVEQIHEVISESVNLHNVSDVPVGSFLSEGIDSSYITSILKPEKVFSVGFDDKTYDEVKNARDLAKMKGFDFYESRVKRDDVLRDFEEMQYHMDEPDGNPSVVPLWYLAKLARKHVTVALSGEGADELFGGYVNYGMHSHNTVIKVFANGLKRLPKNVKAKLSRKLSKSRNFKGKLHLYTSITEPSEYYVGQAKIFDEDYPSIFSAQDANQVLQPVYRNKITVKSIYKPDFEKVKSLDYVRQMQYIDLHHFLVNDILQKADKISMAHSLEVRVPYLDRKVADFANSIKTSYLVNNKDTKYALRKASEAVVPKEWSQRPKLGFPVPIKKWLRTQAFYQTVKKLFSEEFVRDVFDQDKLLNLLEQHYTGEADLQRQIWTVYSFLVWYRAYFIDFEETKAKYRRVQPEVKEMIDQGKLVNT
ncbi:asparagine synthase (glutamine-hydrolyzing) [Holzapfeliella sp. JNUCC 80]